MNRFGLSACVIMREQLLFLKLIWEGNLYVDFEVEGDCVEKVREGVLPRSLKRMPDLWRADAGYTSDQGKRVRGISMA